MQFHTEFGLFDCVTLHHAGFYDASFADFSPDKALAVRNFHKSIPAYQETPLRSLRTLAETLGLGGIFIKDESYRFGLNAFKALGSSFAIASELAKTLDKDTQSITFPELTDPQNIEKIGNRTFITATDGNHGRGVAWTAAKLGMQSVVYMPRGTAPERLQNIRMLGSDASILDLEYDDCVRLAAKNARENGWTLVQDTSFEGYYDIPLHVMQGYTTMAIEADEKLPEKPTHVFLQAGVGSMAGAVAGYFASKYGKDRPKIIIVEPNGANCVFKTAAANDGKLHKYEGSLHSIMAGLCCGEVCPIAWNVLSRCADHFISIPDHAAETGMRVLGSPVGDDPRVISGESGASTSGFLFELMLLDALAPLREELGIDKNSRVLCFSTEGATDRSNYRKTVWGI